MANGALQEEAFSISFNGTAFDGHDIPAAALDQSLLALDGFHAELRKPLTEKAPPLTSRSRLDSGLDLF